MNSIYSLDDSNRVKLIVLLKFFANVVPLIFLALTLIWNKITFPA